MSTSNIPKLPTIEHPLSKLNHQQHFDVCGSNSRPNTQNSQVAPNGCRPLPFEEPILCSRGSSRISSRQSSRGLPIMSRSMPTHPYDIIPEGVETVEGDPTKTKLPVFGMRKESANVAFDRVNSRLASRPNSRVSEITKSRLELDEIETIIKDKLKGAYYEMRKRFVDNDPEQKGNVTRDALLRILVSSTGHPISQSHLSALFERWGFRKDKQMVSFTEVFAAFRDNGQSEYPSWFDPVQRNKKENMPAEKVHGFLREKIRQRFIDLADIFPQFIDGGTQRIMKHELRNGLSKMHLHMEDAEFERLWKQYDPHNTGCVNGITMLKKMGIIMQDAGRVKKQQHSKKTKVLDKPTENRALNEHDDQRKRSLFVENWLKDRLREGFKTLKSSLEAKDPEKTGLVTHLEFLEVLRQHNLTLEKRHLAEFLARCAVPNLLDGVPYRDFLHRFQDRSEAGMTHKIMSNPHHQKEQDETSKTLSSLEFQLMQMFQRDFLALLATFKKIDRLSMGFVTQEEFRALMETRFDLELTDSQFQSFVQRLPLTKDGRVQYDKFLKQFDTTGLTPSLFSEKIKKEEVVECKTVKDIEDDFTFDPNRRHVSETVSEIKFLLRSNFPDVDRAFHELDLFNSGRLTQDLMYELLKRFIQPEITRGEIRDLWKSFFLRRKDSLDFHEFIRYFVYQQSEAAFPNAKIFPPRKGDADLMMRSRKLNGDVILLEDNLRSKIDFLWEQLRNEFVNMDPYGTGCVSKEEFQEVMKELSIQLSDYELNKITEKFTQSSDGRVNYVELLRPFALKKQMWRSNHMNDVLHHPQPQKEPFSLRKTGKSGELLSLHSITKKLRKQLSGDWLTLRRAFKKLDNDKTGHLTLQEFKSVLQLCNVLLDEEEVFHLMSKFDSELCGKISYSKFLEHAKNVPLTDRSNAHQNVAKNAKTY